MREDHLDMVRNILHRHVPQYAVWAFGSRAKWNAKDYSDIDLCIRSDKALDFRTLGALIEDFAESDLPYKVDIVDWATTSESFRKIIEQDKVLIQGEGKKTSVNSEWISTTIGEQLTLQRGFDITKASQQAGNVPVISSGGTSSYHSVAAVKGPGVVLGRKGVVGSVYFVWGDYWPHDTTLWIKDFHGNDELFAYYFFLAKAKVLAQLDVGSANPTLNRNHVHPIKIQWPSVGEQKLIGQMLATLDDRIALLRETNATIEAIAQALFKSWFVDFDPVRAKQEGRAPEGMDEATAALFPDNFEESELGLVPVGWRVEPLDTVANYLNGLALQKFPPEEDNWLPVIKIAQLRKGHANGADRASRNLKPEYIVQDGDVLFSWSGSLEVIIWCGGEGALNQHLFKVTSNDYPKWFYYLWTKYHLVSFQKIAESKATTMGHIQRKHLTEAKVVVPPTNFVEGVGNYFAPLIERWIANSIQTKNLEKLRDTLLPRLISGQLRLPEPDAVQEQAAA